ncbi:hypothetical protein OnM2_063070, partial [Erysiphe neolycopersici]
VPGQDKETINPDRNLSSLVAVYCRQRHTARAAIKVAKTACDKLKKVDSWITELFIWSRSYPAVYPIRRLKDGFDILGNPYFIYPMFKSLLTSPGRHTDFILINEHCQLVGAVVWSKIKKPGKNKLKFLHIFRKSPSGFKKCVVEMTRL